MKNLGESPSWRVRLAIFFVAATFASVFLVNFCDWVYQCGCRSLWNGADAYCNVHQPETRDCPWCEHRPLGDIIPLGAVVLAQLGVCFSGNLGGAFSRFLLALAAFPAAGGVVALVFGWATGYWSQ